MRKEGGKKPLSWLDGCFLGCRYRCDDALIRELDEGDDKIMKDGGKGDVLLLFYVNHNIQSIDLRPNVFG